MVKYFSTQNILKVNMTKLVETIVSENHETKNIRYNIKTKLRHDPQFAEINGLRSKPHDISRNTKRTLIGPKTLMAPK